MKWGMIISNDFLYPKGSVWGKWDLHVHTPIDHEWINKPNMQNVTEKEAFAENFIKFAKNEGLSLIAITDHNFCNDLGQSLLPIIIEKAKKENITILPGFEITVKDGNGLHVLIVFPEDTELVKILNIVNQLFPANFEKIPKNGNIPPSNKTIDEIKLIIDESGLEAIFIFAHADSKNGILNKNTIKGAHRKIVWNKDFIGITQMVKSIPNYKSGFEYEVIHKINPDFKKEMAFVLSSDCRCISKVNTGNGDGRTYLGQNYCWIKSNPTFEGLKHIIYDPQNRIRMPEDEPQEKIGYLVIDKVKFIDNTGKNQFPNEEIELNPNLNTIIGGKSSGKSILLYYIAKTIDPVELSIKSELSGQKYDLDKENFDFEVKWKDGKVNVLKGKEEKNRKITYIPQLYLNKLSEKEGEKRLQIQIQDILLQNSEFKLFFEGINKNIEEDEQRINQLYNNLFVKTSNLKDIIIKLNELGDKNAITDEKLKLETEIEDLRKKSGFSKPESQKYERLHNKKTILDQEISATELTIKNLTDLEDYFGKSVNKLINQAIVKKDEYNLSNEENDAFNEIIKSINDSYYKAIKDNFLIKEQYVTKLKAYSDDRSKIIVDLKPFMDKFNNQKLLLNLNIKLSEQNQLLKQIDEKLKSIVNINKSIDDMKAELVKEYGKLMGDYYKVIKELSKSKYKLISPDIQLEAKLKFREDEFHQRFTEMIDKRGNLSVNLPCFVNNRFIFIEDEHIDYIKNLLNIILDENSNIIKLKDKRDRKDAIEKLFDNYFDIQYDLIHNSDRIMQMSPGKRGLVLLQLILHISNAKHPILIDQPEDNLDNRTISQELIKYINDKKIDRQIIMVTHNANLVVLTDAEEVVVANQDGQKIGRDNRKYRFEYVSGALECSFKKPTEKGILYKKGIKQHVCEILEGGEEAFEKRERKYGLAK